jgi:hypothetical protein
MKTDTYCSQCDHKETCREVYSKLGRYEGPSVFWDVLIAFIVPITVFIGSLAACQRLLQHLLDEAWLNLVGAGIGLCLSTVFVLAAKGLRNRYTKKFCDTR